VNCVIAEASRRRLDDILLPKLRRFAGAAPEVAYLADPESLPDASRHTHLLITGSEQSAADGADTDDALVRTIVDFLVADRAILGICYGHQMLARALRGPEVCRKAARPEFGFLHTEIAEDPLFHGLFDPVFAHSHYDEVAGLDDEFLVIASTKDCPVQAFRYAGRAIWGVQFHPELSYAEAMTMLDENRASDPAVEAVFRNEIEDPVQVAQNERVLANFLAAR
jgi:GMP synthase (glutamine-hydrolysing)